MLESKCLIMAELLNAPGMISESPGEKSVRLAKAAFFCDHALSGIDPTLQARREAICGETGGGHGIVLPRSRQRHNVPPASPRPKSRRQIRPQVLITSRIVLALLVWAGITLAKTFEVSDTTWESGAGALFVRAILHNRTAQTQRVAVQFTADQLSNNTLGNALNFAGKLVPTSTAESNSRMPIESTIALTAAGRKSRVRCDRSAHRTSAARPPKELTSVSP